VAPDILHVPRQRVLSTESCAEIVTAEKQSHDRLTILQQPDRGEAVPFSGPSPVHFPLPLCPCPAAPHRAATAAELIGQAV